MIKIRSKLSKVIVETKEYSKVRSKMRLDLKEMQGTNSCYPIMRHLERS